ncbi:MAG: hypothetical protein ACHQ7N_10990 [Candidatus Methylomirabilales bacterium]
MGWETILCRRPGPQTAWKNPDRQLKREQFFYYLDNSLAIRNTIKPTVVQVPGPWVATSLMPACICDLLAAADEAAVDLPGRV